ncbi:MAG: hypothetical protein Q8M16_02880 [Pirellulaceae bacterium]|nr:hypothetical protein [Pirellulaceae bacterium]
MSTKALYGILSVGIVGVLFAGIAYQQGWFSSQPGAQNADAKFGKGDQDVEKLGPAPDGFQWVGGVLRPDSDVMPQEPLELPDIGDQSIGKRMGRSPEIDPNTNADTRSVAEALAKPEKFPERLSPAFPAKPFDLDGFKADPKAYLTTVEPGRIWQSLEKAEGVSQLSRQSPLYQTLIQGETVALRVKAIPGAPVTFHSFDLGHFENRLTTTSVQAGDDGIASVNFTASGGTFGELNILAASPQTSGQVNFVVKVGLPAVAAAR